MMAESMALSELESLARETAGAEWAGVADTAAALAPEDVPGEILVGRGYYGDYLLDGWHRVAGLLAWARETGADADDVDITISRMNESETSEWGTRNA